MIVLFGNHNNKQNNMFKTALRDSSNPERFAKTAIMTTRKKVSLEEGESGELAEWGNYSTLRPKTTMLMRKHNYATISTTGRSSHFVDLRSLSAVENELEERYKEDMNPYLKQKLRKIIEKRQESVVYDRYLQSTIDDDGQTDRASSNKHMSQFYSTFNQSSRLQVEKGVDEAYIVTAKQRIERLIDMKRQRQSNFSQLNSKIRQKCEMREEAKQKVRPAKKKTIEQQDWDKQWRNQCGKQVKRYRNRLVNKCRKHQNNYLSLME